jgi:hypothetical protein
LSDARAVRFYEAGDRAISGPYLSRQAMATFIGPLMARSPAS